MFKYTVFEGADGIGKTILAKNFAKKFGCEYIFEPFAYDQTTQYLRSLSLTHDVSKLAREYLLLANRSFGYEKINEILDSDKLLVSDRSYLSGAVYAYMEGFRFEKWEKMARPLLTMRSLYHRPTVIFCTNEQFNNKNDESDRYDGKPEEFHRKVEETFRLAFKFFMVPVIEFSISFNHTQEENLQRLMDRIDQEAKPAFIEG